MNFKDKSFFETQSLVKLSLKVVLPSLIVSLLFGIYIFVDQILMQNIIPNNNINYLYNDFLSKNFTDIELSSIYQILYPLKNESGFLYKDLYDIQNNLILSKALFVANKDMLFLAITTIGTINLIFISLGFFINSGASVLYSRSIAKKNSIDCKNIWISSFYSCLFSSILILCIMLGVQNPIIKITIPSATNAASGYESNPLILKYFELRNEAVLRYTSQYTYFITCSIPIIMYLNLLIFFVRAEGKNLFITTSSLLANLINVLFDVIFFKLLSMNIIGGGIATFIGYIVNMLLMTGYVCFLDKKNLINFSFKDLVNFKIKLNYLASSFILSLGTFLRDISLAIANVIYIPVFSSTMATLISNNAINQSFLNDIFAVSVTPLYNLFFFAMYGIIDGARPIIAYNYQQQNFRKVKQTYYASTLVGITFAILVNVILFSSLNDNLLSFFNANTESRKEAILLLFYTTMFQLPFIAISISGLSLFQSNGKMTMTIILSLFQGLICFVPILFTMSSLAVSLNNAYIMIFTGFTNIAISSLLIEIISEIYLHRYMGLKEKSQNPVEQIDKVISFIDKKLLKKDINYKND